MDIFEIIIIIILVIVAVYLDYKNKHPKTKNTETTEEPEATIKDLEKMPYKKKLLLTKNEWSFYKALKPAADELGYTVLAKIRVADLVEVTTSDRSEWQKYFNKVNKKHIDFALAKPDNLQIVLLIELDDNTHNDTQKKRDEFIEDLYKQTGYKLLRTKGTAYLKEAIETALL